MEKVNKAQDESILVPTLKVGALAGKSSTFSALKSLASLQQYAIYSQVMVILFVLRRRIDGFP